MTRDGWKERERGRGASAEGNVSRRVTRKPKRLCYTGARRQKSFETRAEFERRLTGTESHQSRRAGLRGVEHAETQTDGARGGRRRRAHALGRARRAAGHVPESSAHGRAEKNVSVIRGVEITHCVRSRRGIRAIVSRSRLRLVGVDPRARSSFRLLVSRVLASTPRFRASTRGITRRGVTPPRDARPIVRTKTSPRAPVRETKPRDRRCSRAESRLPLSRLASSRARTDSR